MRAVIQRVHGARVSFDGKVVGECGKGLLILCAFKNDETEEKLAWAAKRVANCRIFRDGEGKLNRSVIDENGSCLVVSNFTLYGDVAHGRRPNFSLSAGYDVALPLYERFIELLSAYVPVQKGAFGERMSLSIEADGPVTVVLDN